MFAAGDSRAIIVQRQGKVVAMSSDHKVRRADVRDGQRCGPNAGRQLTAAGCVQPNRTDEKERIRQLGGSVFLVGVWRVEGILAVSR